jgi:4-amino-4-deoxy-L-arabinose transferase-like glycosyltransferase
MLFIASLLFTCFAYPLMQNDPLEYATLGRALFEARDLSIYPLVNTAQDASGFFGPWTHPPLYVSMIYTAFVLQDSTEFPGLMRAISPWFALCSAGLIYALGNTVNRRTGLFAAAFFFAAPLFFLGASASVIDTLPVLSMLLIVSCCYGTTARPTVAGAIVGVALGLALWTHSQAILFLPLTLVALVLAHGFAQWRPIMIQYGVVLLVAAAIAWWPYWHNIQVFGALISDEPVGCTSELSPKLVVRDYVCVLALTKAGLT